MKLQLILLSLGFILIDQTCSKEIVLPNPELKKIFGRWEWIESSGGFAGKITTPVKAGITQEIEFSKEGIWQKYKNGTLAERKKYSVAEGNSILKKETAYIISFSSVDSTVIQSVEKQSVRFGGNDTLFLNKECFDCFAHVFVRIK